MKLPPLEYYPARDLQDAVEALDAPDDDARVIAGGQSLLPVLALRLAEPSRLVDVSTCRDLRTFHVTDDDVIVSAAVAGRTIESDRELRSQHPLLVDVVSRVGHPEIRNKGTLCGSVAHADPAAEVPALLLACDGRVRVIGPRGRRKISADEFLVGPFMTALAPGELVAGIEIPRLDVGAGWSIQELARRHGDFAVAGAIVMVDLDLDQRCRAASVVVFGIASTPLRRHEAESLLVGELLTDDVIATAAHAALDQVEVLGDVHAGADFRRHACSTLVRRALTEAKRRAIERATTEAEH